MHRLALRALSVVALMLCIAATASAQFTLSTSIDNNNSQSGVMFDVTAATDLRITGIDMTIDSTPRVYEVYRVSAGGSFVGFETDASAWTLCGSNTAAGATSTVATPLNIALDIELAAGETLGLYVTSTSGSGPTRYTNGSDFGGVRAQTPHLTLLEGVGKDYPFGSTFGGTTLGGSSRMFNGNVHYELGSSGEGDALLTSSGPDSSGTGLVFDIEAHEPVTIESLALDLEANTHTIEVWTTREGGPAAAAAGSPGAWQRVGRVNNFTNGGPGRFDVGLDLDVPIAPGQSRGFYVTRTSSAANDIQFTQFGGTLGNISESDGNISLKTGQLSDYFLTNPGALGNAAFSGDVRYRRNLDLNAVGPSTATSALSTVDGPFASQGMMFDVAASGSTFTQITRIDAIFSIAGTHNMELYAVVDRTSHIGKENDATQWELIASGSVTATSTTAYTTVFNNLRTVIEPGIVQGLYLTTTDGTFVMSYSSGSGTGTVYASNSYIELRTGQRQNYPFITAIPNRAADVRVWTERNSNTVTRFAENFSSGVGINPPNGWLTHVSLVNNPAVNGWNFDDPQPLVGGPPAPPISGRFASVDSDLSGPGSQDDASLYTPRFNASSGSQRLAFDHWHRPLNSTINVDVWDGSGWNNVLSTSGSVFNSTRELIDITAAAGGSSQARVRFRYQGAYDWHWAIDNVRLLGDVGDGQAPRPGLGVMDVNFATETNGQPVSSNLPGPYFSDAYSSTPVDFYFEGEPNQPIILLQGPLNPNAFAFTSPFDIGKLDIGMFNPMTAQFINVEEIANGTLPGFTNLLFFTDGTGARSLSFSFPPFLAGATFTFQSVILSSNINAAFTNAVSVDVIN